MTLPQRVVLSIGLGVALLLAAAWWVAPDYLTDGGWFAYAPGTSTDTYFAVRERNSAHLAIALGAVGVWTTASVALFGLRSAASSEPPAP